MSEQPKNETNRQKAERLMLSADEHAVEVENILGSGAAYRTSPAHQTAGLTRATLAVADELAASNAIAADRLAAEQASNREARIANVIAFYAVPEQMYPAGVRDQLAAALGIQLAQVAPHAEGPATPSVPAAAPDTEPEPEHHQGAAVIPMRAAATPPALLVADEDFS